MISIYLSIYFAYHLTLVLMVRSYNIRENKESRKIDLAEVTVIIPFRNEKQRIDSLLLSINQQKIFPAKFIFIDDHSSDNTSEHIRKVLKENISYEVIEAPVSCIGKKECLDLAIRQSSLKWILTLDADVKFDEDYFIKIGELDEAEMNILPVRFVDTGFIHNFFNNDITLSQFMNVFASRFKRPIMASGANLLFSRNTYLEESRRDHYSLLSGDDQFLLRDFLRSHRTISLLNEGPEVQVESPKTIKELLTQRARWIGKSGAVKDGFANLLLLIQVSWIFLFTTLFINYLFTNIEVAAYLCLLFALTNYLLFLPFYRQVGSMRSWFWLPVYLLLLPFYSILILIFSVSKPEWKGRKQKNSDYKIGVQ